MTSFTKLGPNYFKNYLGSLPENAQANRKFSYEPWASNCPELSLKNVFGIIRFVLTYPVVHLRDFWKARQVKQSNEQARQVALAALKKEVADEELTPIRHLALLSNATLLSRKAQGLIESELEALDEDDEDLRRAINDGKPSDFRIALAAVTEGSDADDLEGLHTLATELSSDADTLFLEMLTQRLPAHLYAEAATSIENTLGYPCDFGDENIDDRIEVDQRTIYIDRTITLKYNDNEIGTLKIQAVFDCQQQIGHKRFTVTLNEYTE